MRQIIRNILVESMTVLNEGTINDFKYDAVRKVMQAYMNNLAVTPDDISPKNYFVVCFGFGNNHLFSTTSSSKSETQHLIKYYKNDDNVWKIYVEKPLVGAKVFTRTELGWKEKL